MGILDDVMSTPAESVPPGVDADLGDGPDPGEFDPAVLYPEHLIDTPPQNRIAIPTALPITPARVSFAGAGNVTFDAVSTRPTLLGALADIGVSGCSLLLSVLSATGGVAIAGDNGALAGQRFLVVPPVTSPPSTIVVRLDGIDHVYAWAVDPDGGGVLVTVSWALLRPDH